jgi:hypothetical protein
MRVILVVACALVVSACGAGSELAGNSQVEPSAARVGPDVVSAREVEELLQQARRSFRARGRVFPSESDPYFAVLRDEAVRYLVEHRLREQVAEQLGIDVSVATRKDALHLETYRAIVRSRRPGETVREALARWRKVLEERFARVTYDPRYRPAEQRRSIPPELRNLPEPAPSCDLKTGMYRYLVARAHGCLSPDDEDVSYTAPPCPEIPATEDDEFMPAEADGGYLDYLESGTADHDFFEPLTTNREDLASEANPEGPMCQDFVGEVLVSVGDVGFRSGPARTPIAP